MGFTSGNPGGNNPRSLYSSSHFYMPGGRGAVADPISAAIAEVALLAMPAGAILRIARGSKLLGALSHVRRP